MAFISGWIFSAVCIFILELLLMFVGQLFGNYFHFAYDNDFSFSKVKGCFFCSMISGLIISII